MKPSAWTRRLVSPFFLFAAALSLLALSLVSTGSAQPGQMNPPVADGASASTPIVNRSQEPGGVEPWFDAGPGWEPLDPRFLPGREGTFDDSRIMLWNGGPSFESCRVKTDYVAQPGAEDGDGRVSVLIHCTPPQAGAEMATGYEVTVEQSRAMRILRLDADGKSTVLAESPGMPAPMVGGRSYVIVVERSGAELTAKVHAKDEPEPKEWQVTASDATYGQGRVGVAAAGARGRIISMNPTGVEPVAPGQPGKPLFE